MNCALSIYKPSLLSRRGGPRLAERLLVGTRWLVPTGTLAAADLHTSSRGDVTTFAHCADTDWLSVSWIHERCWSGDTPLQTLRKGAFFTFCTFEVGPAFFKWRPHMYWIDINSHVSIRATVWLLGWYHELLWGVTSVSQKCTKPCVICH